jgi:hypothetical protein
VQTATRASGGPGARVDGQARVHGERSVDAVPRIRPGHLQLIIQGVFNWLINVEWAATAADNEEAPCVGAVLDMPDEIVDSGDVDKLERTMVLVQVKAAAKGAVRGSALADASEDKPVGQTEGHRGRGRELEGEEVFQLSKVHMPDEFGPPSMCSRVLVDHQIVLNGMSVSKCCSENDVNVRTRTKLASRESVGTSCGFAAAV